MAGSRFARGVLLVAAIGAWWVGSRVVSPALQGAVRFDQVEPPAQTVLGHWVMWQLPSVVLCVAVWIVGQRAGLLPPLLGALGSGGSWSRVLRSGALASLAMTVLTLLLGVAIGAKFEFHPPYVKMVGDLVSNLYEEIVNRGLFFSAFYGVAAGASFPLAGPLDRRAVAVATVGSCFVFAASHTQYPVPLRALLGTISVVFVWPWVQSRSLWGAWMVHMAGDIVGDSILTL